MWLRDTVRSTSLGKSVARAAADFARDVGLTVSRNHAVFLLYQECCVKAGLKGGGK